MTQQLECLVRDCVIPGQHATDCRDYTKCSGCLPGLKADGLQTCRHHRDMPVRELEKLPLLYAQLGDRLNVYRSPQAPKPEGGRSAPVDDGDDETKDAAIAARQGLKWMRPAVVQGTRQAPSQLDLQVFEARLAILEKLSAIAAYIVVQKGLAIAPGGDVARLAAFLTREADWLCSHERACRPHYWGDTIADLRRGGQRLVNRARASGMLLGTCPTPIPVIEDDGRVHREPCGGPIRWKGDEPLVECPWCKTSDTVEWWRQRIAGDVAETDQLAAGELAMLLSVKFMGPLRAQERAISETTIRKWKWSGRLVEWTSLCDLKSKRVSTVYDRVEAEQVARHWLGLDDEQVPA